MSHLEIHTLTKQNTLYQKQQNTFESAVYAL